MVYTKSIKEISEIASFLNLTEAEVQNIEKISKDFPILIPPYYLSLINPADKKDPIRKMCVPTEFERDLSGTFDTSGESDNTVITGMQHKYKQTAMILSTNKCAMYCRHCFRKRLVGISDSEIAKNFEKMAEYIRNHSEVTNVLISGGDSFLNSNKTIKQLLDYFSNIEHLDFIRFGTRLPVVLPNIIYENDELLEILKEYSKKKTIYAVTQFNHPNEITQESAKAVKALQNSGIVVKNQTVLLKGINDNSNVLSDLLKKLTIHGVVPYYIFQCRPVSGVKTQFQVPIKKAYHIIEKAKSLQNGQGKCFKYCFSCESGKIEVVGELPSGEMVFKFHESKYEKDEGRLFIKDIGEDDCWLYNVD